MKLLTYKKFSDQQQADDLCAILEAHDIPFVIEEFRDSLDFLYGDKQFRRTFVVKIRDVDISNAENILAENDQLQMESVEADHYLFSFTDEELLDLVTERDEWSEFDFLLAQKILRDRGHDLNETVMDTLATKRIRKLARQDDADLSLWVYIGYMVCAGGLPAILIGWYLRSAKKSLRDGKRINSFTPQNRTHGSIMMTLGAVVLAIWSGFAFAAGRLG